MGGRFQVSTNWLLEKQSVYWQTVPVTLINVCVFLLWQKQYIRILLSIILTVVCVSVVAVFMGCEANLIVSGLGVMWCLVEFVPGWDLEVGYPEEFSELYVKETEGLESGSNRGYCLVAWLQLWPWFDLGTEWNVILSLSVVEKMLFARHNRCPHGPSSSSLPLFGFC